MPYFSIDALPSTAVAGRIKYETGWQRFGRRLKRPALYYSFSGSLRFTIGKKSVLLPPRTALLLDKDTSYSVLAEENCDYCYFHFELSETTAHAVSEEADDAPSVGLLRPREKGFFLPAATPLTAPREQLEHLAVSALRHVPCTRVFDKTRLDLALLRLLLLLGESYTRPDSDSPGLKSRNTYLAIRDYIEAHYPENPSLASISADMGVSPQYAARIFRKHAEESVTSALQRVRIEKAQELLRYTPLPIGEISFAVGFSSPYYFTRVFHRFTGVSPSAFRRSAREEL